MGKVYNFRSLSCSHQQFGLFFSLGSPLFASLGASPTGPLPAVAFGAAAAPGPRAGASAGVWRGTQIDLKTIVWHNWFLGDLSFFMFLFAFILAYPRMLMLGSKLKSRIFNSFGGHFPNQGLQNKSGHSKVISSPPKLMGW